QSYEHVIGHAVQPADGDGPDDDLQRQATVGQIFRTAQNPDEQGRKQRGDGGNGQGNEHHDFERHTESAARILHVALNLARDDGEEGKGEEAGNDVDSIDPLESAVIPAHSLVAVNLPHQGHVDEEENGRQQVIEHQRITLDNHDALQGKIDGPGTTQLEITKRGKAQDSQRNNVDNDRNGSQPHKPITNNQRHDAETNLQNGGDGGDGCGRFGRLVSIEEAGEALARAGEDHAYHQQQDSSDGLRAKRIAA